MEAIYQALRELGWPTPLAGLITIYYGCDELDWDAKPEVLMLTIQGYTGRVPIGEILLWDRVDIIRMVCYFRRQDFARYSRVPVRSIAAYEVLRTHRISRVNINIYPYGDLALIRKYGVQPDESELDLLCAHNSLEVIDYVRCKYGLIFGVNQLRRACGTNTLPVIDYLAGKVPVTQRQAENILLYTCYRNTAEAIMHVAAKYNLMLNKFHLGAAIAKNSLAVVQFLMETIGLQLGNAFYRFSNREVARYLVQNQGLVLTPEYLTELCTYARSIEVINYATYVSGLTPTSQDLEQACRSSTIQVVRGLIETYHLKPKACHLAAACRSRSTPHKAKFLIQNYNLKPTPEQLAYLERF